MTVFVRKQLNRNQQQSEFNVTAEGLGSSENCFKKSGKSGIGLKSVFVIHWMAGVMELVNKEQIRFAFIVNNIENLSEFYTKKVYLHEKQWQIRIAHRETARRNSLKIYLYSKNENVSNNWATLVSFSVSLVPSDGNRATLQKNFKYGFTSKSLNWGWLDFISWEELLNPDNGYVVNGGCKFQIEIEAMHIEDVTYNELLNFKTLRKCCADSSYGKFQLKINKFDEFFGICTPEFELRKSQFQIYIFEDKGDVTVFICNRSTREFVLSMLCKLVLPDSNIVPLQFKFEKQKLSSNDCRKALLTSKQKLLIIHGNFIENNSIIIEIEIDVDPTTNGPHEHKKMQIMELPMEHKRKRDFDLECTICFERLKDRRLSSLKCGHTFCTLCIIQSIENAPVCPLCKQEALLEDFRSIFLPWK